MFFLTGIILGKGKTGKKSTFTRTLFLGLKEKNQVLWALDRISKVMGRGRLCLSVGLTVLLRVVRSEEAKLSGE